MVISTADIEPEVQCTAICQSCGQEFKYESVFAFGREFFKRTTCDACLPKPERIRVETEEVSREREWFGICPPLYHDSDPKLLKIEPDVLRRVLEWQISPRGIGLSGVSGAGKTRAMFMLLRKFHFSGVRVRAFSAKKFERWCHNLFDKDDDARIRVLEAHQAAIVFIDDIGKEKYTERVESEFYDLIEDRTAHLRPILWTANASGDQLKRMLGEDRGAPIVRRLREFSEIISV